MFSVSSILFVSEVYVFFVQLLLFNTFSCNLFSSILFFLQSISFMSILCHSIHACYVICFFYSVHFLSLCFLCLSYVIQYILCIMFPLFCLFLQPVSFYVYLLSFNTWFVCRPFPSFLFSLFIFLFLCHLYHNCLYLFLFASLFQLYTTYISVVLHTVLC